jgi:hypothetical protein
MKPLAYIRHKYTGDFYKYVRETVGDTSTLKYYFVGNVALTAGIDKTGRMTIRTDQPVAVGSLIANIKVLIAEIKIDWKTGDENRTLELIFKLILELARLLVISQPKDNQPMVQVHVAMDGLLLDFEPQWFLIW